MRTRHDAARSLLIGSALAILLVAGTARAQFSVQKFQPGTHALDYLSVSSAEVNGHLRPHVGLVFDLATHPLVFEHTGKDIQQQIIEQIMVFDLVGSISMFERLEFGVDVPMALISGQQGSSIVTVGEPPSFSLGDLRLNAKATILPHEREGWGLAVQLGMTAPTGADDSFVSEANFTFIPKVIAEFNYEDYRVALNLGYRMRENSSLGFLDINDELLMGLAVSIPVYERQLFVLGELQGATDVTDFFAGRNTRYLEGNGGVKWVSDLGIYATLAGGTGFLMGAGNPAVRVIAAVGWAPEMYKPRDTDLDGIPDKVDACPERPEDMDGYRDTDGCPDPDNDSDGIPDLEDRCPIRAEDKDNFEDTDGCPDPDNDGDGIPDGDDRCRDLAEDEDNYKDQDGCPDPDNDSDGVLDSYDKCPSDPETLNEYQDEDGCPDTPPVVYVSKEKIVITQKIFFKKGTARILKKSRPVLDAVGDILAEHTEITLISVEGHTSTEGSAWGNKRLSEKRAKAIVQYLKKKGVAKERLQHKGWGEEMPLTEVPEKTEEERETNRRVEFLILQQK